MFGRRPRSWRHSRARASRALYEFTISAFDGRGAGVVSIQLLIWKNGAVAGPRLGRQEKSAGLWNVYGVSCMDSHAGRSHGTPCLPDSMNTTNRWPQSIRSRNVGNGLVSAPV